MKIGIVQFPGSNCRRETKLAIERLGFEAVDCFWHANPALVDSLDGYIIVGGFSYEDRVRSGVIAALDPIMQNLQIQANRGKPILGICNGAQILVASGLMPPMTLTNNHRPKGLGYYNDWVYMRQNKPGDTPIYLPIAHAEGRFLMEPQVFAALAERGVVCYHYCDSAGQIIPDYPINPNGSHYNLAAVSNIAGNVMAMMPHPERTSAGDVILRRFFEPFQEKIPLINREIQPLVFQPTRMIWQPYVREETLEYWVRLLIDDNEAISLQNALQRLQIAIEVKKFVHWQVIGATEKDDPTIQAQEELFNLRKECLVSYPAIHATDRLFSQPITTYFIREKQDEIAGAKQAVLSQQLGRPIRLVRDVVWVMHGDAENQSRLKKLLEEKLVLAHPLSHEGFIDETRKST